MLSITRQWVLGLLVGFSVILFAFNANATTVDDPTITDVGLSISSNVPGATNVAYTVTFTTNAAIPAGEAIWFDVNPGDCREANWDDCRPNFDGATLSGLSGASIDWATRGNFVISTDSSLAAGSYSVTLSGVANPNFNGSIRGFIGTSASDVEGYANEVWVRTHTDAVVIGTPFFSGTVVDVDGNGMGMWGQIYDKDWTISQGFSIDEWGYFAVENPGFTSGQKFTFAVYPDQSSGYTQTSEEFTYSGTPLSVTVELVLASKTIEGSLTFGDTGEVVTTAAVFANSSSAWANAIPDEGGNYEMHVGGGEYNVCVGDQWSEDGKRVTRNWYADPGTECQEVEFEKNDDEETETLDWELNRTDAVIRGVIKNPGGSFPERGGWVNFSTEQYWFGSSVSNVDGSFEVAVVGGNTSSITSTSLRFAAIASMTYTPSYNSYNQDEHTYWDAEKVTVNANDELDLGEITLKERDVVFTATVLDNNSDPVNDISVNAWIEGSQGGWANAQTDENGVAVLYLYEGSWTIMPNTWEKPGYVYTGQGHRATYVAGDTDSATFSLEATTVNVSVNARDANGNIIDVNGWANCWSPDGGSTNFGGQLQHGTGSFGAVGGTYNCNLWVNDPEYQATGDEFLEFEDGVDEVLDFTLLNRSATILVTLKNQDNEKVNPSYARISANSPEMGWSNAQLEDGVATLRVAPGMYHVSVWFEGNQSEYLFSWSAGKDVTVAEGETKNRVLMVNEVSGTLTASLVDTEGNPVQYAWVGCGNWPELDGKVTGDFDSGRIIESGSQSGADGDAVVGLVKDHEYDCWVGAPMESDLIGPESQQISLLKQDDVEKTFTFQVADSTIEGTATLVDADGNEVDEEFDQMWCSGWAEEGYSSFDNAFGNEYSMAAVAGTWHVWCGTEVVNDEGEREFYNTFEETQVKVESGDTAQRDVVLSTSIFEIPDPVSETFDATTQKTIVLPDGAVLTIPAGALSTSGNVTVTAEPEVGAMHTYTDSPFGIPWNFEAFDSDNALISGDFNSMATLQINYDDDKLQQMEVDETNILPKYWDDDTSAWLNVDNASQDMDANTISFNLSHFTTVGLTYNKQMDVADKPNKPRQLSANSVSSTSAVLHWKKPKKTGAGSYKLQVRKDGVKKQKQWRKFKGISKTQRAVNKLKPNMRYQFRVRACAGSSCSKWTDWKAFKTASE